MARAKAKAKTAKPKPRKGGDGTGDAADKDHPPHKTGWSGTFSHIASMIAHAMGKPVTFLIACTLVILWAASGPLFGFSDTWQLVINTSTTIVTFLMVFLIQNTQNRDTMALQLKMSEMILVMSEAENRFADAEDLSEEELEALHKELHERAQTTLGHLNKRRGSGEPSAA
jgi:low affinity Fe/Cu permease